MPDENTRPQSLTLEDAASTVASLFPDTSAEDHGNDEPKSQKEAPASEEATPEPEEQSEQPEGEEQSEAEEEQDEQQESEKPQTYRVKVDGEEAEVTLDELLKGYSRTSDYTRKTQALSEARKKFEAEELPAVRAERALYAERLAQLDDSLRQMTPAEPDWATLQQTADPAEFAATWAAWQQHKQTLDRVKAEREKADAAVRRDRDAAETQRIEAERARVLDVIPGWKKPEVAKKEAGAMREYAHGLGFTDADLAAVTDHRVLKLLRDAWQASETAKAKPAVEKAIEKVRAATPGPSAGSKKPVTELTRAKQRLAKTGSLEDAAAVFAQMMP